MRGVVLAISVVALLAPSARAQTTAWADKLFGGVTNHDFGVVARGTQLKYSFKMTNIYKEALEIQSTADLVQYAIRQGIITAWQ